MLLFGESRGSMLLVIALLEAAAAFLLYRLV
jgi:hypothetical protein